MYKFGSGKALTALLLAIVLCCQLFAGCQVQQSPVITCNPPGISASKPTVPTNGTPPSTTPTEPEILPTEPDSNPTEPVPSDPAVTEPTTQPTLPSCTHSYGAWMVSKEPSCTEKGSKYRICSACQKKETESISKTAHTIAGGKCSQCGYTKTSYGITYESNGDGTCSVVDLGNCTDSDLVIPSRSPDGDLVTAIRYILENTYGSDRFRYVTIPESVTYIVPGAFQGGVAIERFYVDANNPVFYVVSGCLIDKTTGTLVASEKNCSFPTDVNIQIIGDYAFADRTNITSVTFPSSVHTIGKYAFSGTKLTSVTFPSNIHTIGTSAFSATNITSVVVPNTVTTMGRNVFGGCVKLKSAVIGDGVTELLGTFYGCTSLKEVTLGKNLKNVDAFDRCSSLVSLDIPEGVEKIGNFEYCTSLVSINIPKTVRQIGYFTNCTSLKSIVIPEGVTSLVAFTNCTSLESVTIPDSITYYGTWSVFAGCTSLKSIYIPEGVTTLDKYAFKGCTSLEHVVLPRSMEVLKDAAFSGCISLKTLTVGDKLRSIPYDAFDDCDNLEYIYASHSGGAYFRAVNNCLVSMRYNNIFLGSANSTIPTDGSVTKLGTGLNGKKIKHIEIPDFITVVSRSAFGGCTELETVVLHDKIQEIEEYAFAGCTSLREIVIPSSVTYIGEGVFSSCSALETISLEGNTNYRFVENCLIEIATGRLISGTNRSVIPDDGSVKIIGNYAFYGLNELTELYIPDSVLTIEAHAFSNMQNLNKLVISGSVTTIGAYAFEYLPSLVELEIPGSVETMGAFTISLCVGLKTLRFGEGLKYIEEQAFSYNDNMAAYLPISLVAYDCSADITYYAGTMAQWAKVDTLYNCTVICSDGVAK